MTEMNRNSYDFVLAEILTEVRTVKEKVDVVDAHQQKINQIEQTLAVTSTDIVNLTDEIKAMKDVLNKPPVPWMMKAAGIAAIGSIAMSTITLIGFFGPQIIH